MEEMSQPPVLLAPMPAQAEVRAPEDDWTGLTDARERRRLQNRLNQRLWRKRSKATAAALASKKRSSLARTDGNDVSALPFSNSATASSAARVTDMSPPPIHGFISTSPGCHALSKGTVSLHSHPLPTVLAHMAIFESAAWQHYLSGSPRLDMLLTLIQFNVLRALISNTVACGFATTWLGDEDALSPWYSGESGCLRPQCPPALQPTFLQRTVPHHPWIDLFPFPEMRDNMLLATQHAGERGFDENELCNHLVDFREIAQENTGLIVWTEPSDPSGWEVSEAFLRKWRWLLEGCQILKSSTDAWRKRRGQKALFAPQ